MTGDSTRAVYKAALIGCGSMGSYYMDELVGLTTRTILPVGHAEVLKTNSRTRLVAGADPDRGRLEDFGRRWEVPGLYQDYREMLARERPDIVSIASPPELHPEHVLACAEFGVKGVFCEKPLAPSLREADAMLDACAATGMKLAINHTRRGEPHNHRARELILRGEIGEIRSIVVTWAGRLFLTGTHAFDLVNYFASDAPTAWLIGHTEDPNAEMAVVPTQRGVDVGGTAYVVYENGIRAFVNGRDGQAGGFRIDLYGTKGVLNIDGHDSQLWKENAHSRFRELLKYPFPQMMRYTAPMVFLLEDLMDAVETDKEPMSSGRHARHALAQILATHYSSSHDSAKVRFPFEELDMRPPFRWAGSDGGAIYRVTNPSRPHGCAEGDSE